MNAPAACTILARNYLPKALALAESLRRHHGETPLTVFVTDATQESGLPDVPGVRWMFPAMLDVPERTLLELAMFYDLVEFATAVKPLVLQRLLEEHEQVVYLDPDTYVTSPMAELGPALRDSPGGILLTPHYLAPPPSDNWFSEGHLLHVGVYNLGFCAVRRSAGPFLAWWWQHLKTECLHDPISGLFVDQKWVDIGSVFFRATSFQHRGYNVGVGNLHERPIVRDADGYKIAGTDDRLRLFHFHAFDPDRPEELYTRRVGVSTAHLRADSEALDTLCKEYAAAVIANRQMLGSPPAYVYDADTTGRPISRRMRHAYRAAVLAGQEVPSPFVPQEADEYTRWRRSAWRLATRLMLSDLAKGVRFALPDEYLALKRRLPGVTRRLQGSVVEKSGMWG